MPTRRPKVPRPAAPANPDRVKASGGNASKPVTAKPAASKTAAPRAAAPRAAAKTAAPRAAAPKAAAPKAAAPKAAAKKSPAPKAEAKQPAARKTEASKAGAQPGNQRFGKLSASDARAAVRSQLSGAIRRKSDPAPESKAPAAVPEVEAPDELRPVPAKAFSGRLLVLAMVMVAITVLLAPSVRTYLQQRSEIAVMKTEIAEAQATQAELEVQLGRWEDPAYIKQQARDRIFLVMPGEKRYLVKGENGVEQAEELAAEEEPEDLQWVDSLWDSVKKSATAQ
ncbi:septum formation initiator family protein [Arthrobacter sp. zg-Y1171]|uniref:FtsB family cell division protein n=1 Tax=Arthrobacter sp. zg-Y1171 TaxID=2964610 RepID=UPI002104D6C9|nr:septum formation initiator family protein [Arthrobacter sp. zg-Y1171]MCQ1996337.1 septum formation initiator family protein [Arthrobacter sp. zg-Y1171]UWX82617.1 septum formation initiator family protein [Arthrobacter sp. zg-Y1171]